MLDSTQSNGIILVVDDSADALSMLNEALRDQGYTIFIAMDGAQALEIAQKMPPDVILLDALMPNMDGFETCQALKENSELSDIPVIFMTGLSDTQHVVRGLELGGVDYINKPVNIDELLARIKVHLNTARRTRSVYNALDEIGQQVFSCDLQGQLLWRTASASQLFASVGADETWLTQVLPTQLVTWLSRNPERHSSLRLQIHDKPLQVTYLSRPNPEEYLLRLLDDDELSARNALRREFNLTGREAEVLFWLAHGKTNREIAQILSMSPRTVNKHLETVFRKLSVENRATATAVCLRFLSFR